MLFFHRLSPISLKSRIIRCRNDAKHMHVIFWKGQRKNHPDRLFKSKLTFVSASGFPLHRCHFDSAEREGETMRA